MSEEKRSGHGCGRRAHDGTPRTGAATRLEFVTIGRPRRDDGCYSEPLDAASEDSLLARLPPL